MVVLLGRCRCCIHHIFFQLLCFLLMLAFSISSSGRSALGVLYICNASSYSKALQPFRRLQLEDVLLSNSDEASPNILRIVIVVMLPHQELVQIHKSITVTFCWLKGFPAVASEPHDGLDNRYSKAAFNELRVGVTEYRCLLKENYHSQLVRRLTTLKPSKVKVAVYLHDATKRRELKERNLGLVSSNGSHAYSVSVGDSMRGFSAKVTDRFWCVGRPWATEETLQTAMDWACGPGGADCNAIQLGEPCYVPNAVLSHASYAFNSYFQIHLQKSGTCDFGGAAMITDVDPSYPGCTYPFRSGQVGASVSGSGLERKYLSVLVSLLHLVFSLLLLC